MQSRRSAVLFAFCFWMIVLFDICTGSVYILLRFLLCVFASNWLAFAIRNKSSSKLVSGISLGRALLQEHALGGLEELAHALLELGGAPVLHLQLLFRLQRRVQLAPQTLAHQVLCRLQRLQQKMLTCQVFFLRRLKIAIWLGTSVKNAFDAGSWQFYFSLVTRMLKVQLVREVSVKIAAEKWHMVKIWC